ncbi:MAG: rhodanese-like domain-containing protein [Calditrichaeota bacterium]|nr:rhodanese-like domain-containing protein [Calditrichota bacterium]
MRPHRDFWVLLFFLTTTSVVYWIAAGEHFKIRAVKSNDFLSFVQDHQPVVVDLREDNERSRLPLTYPHLIHRPFLSLVDEVESFPLDPERDYLLVCSDGNRARLIATQFAEIGHMVFYLQNGLWGLNSRQLAVLTQLSFPHPGQ